MKSRLSPDTLHISVALEDMTNKLNGAYEPNIVETEIYRKWEESGFFNPDNLKLKKGVKPFTIIMPPPNANGALHVGHALFVTLEDIMIRFQRMRGKKTLWLPGADHAGFETQVVFDKKLEKEGKKRSDFSRDELYQKIWDFTQENKKVMENQLRKLGASCDWSREKFTLDPNIIKIVYETFGKLYDDGLAYRDNRIVNWCVKHQTTLSELETKYVEREDPLYYIKYGPLELATVRLETKFGDTAVAVNPKDKRYAKLVGKEIEIKTLLGTTKIKVIADDAVDMEFGTGAVKVTPAHDPNDFEIWKRHKDEIPGPKTVIDQYGRIDLGAFSGNEKSKRYHGLKIAEARKLMAEDMEKEGLMAKIDKNYKHSVATCYKCGTTLEPRILPQWFVKTKPLADKAIKAAEKNKITFHPESDKQFYLRWLKNIRDWNISRQIVWGIRIPAWYCLSCSEPKINPEVRSKWFLVRHGETDLNKNGRASGGGVDVPLNETGFAQAEKAAAMLAGEKIDLIISSHLTRAKQTAEAIAKATGAEIIFDEELRERNMGKMEGLSHHEIKNTHPSFWKNFKGKDAGNESYEELEERVSNAFKKHKGNHRHKNIVIVSHGGTIRMLIKSLRNLDPDTALSRPVIPNATPISIDVLEKPCVCGSDLAEQDSDVFDTWFSSGQWPFATLLASSKKSVNLKSKILNLKSDFDTFYPTDVMETGYDILFFWVARMVMLGLYVTGKIPFKTVYLNGLVFDKDRKKMSKSKGNVIDPLGVAEIYGSDALRMALVAGNTAGNDIVISEDKIRGYRNFVTKVWNISRFILMNKEKSGGKAKLSTTDKKNLAELKKIKTKVGKHIEQYEFHLAAETIYHYIWHNFADKIIESYKSRLNGENKADAAAAYATLETILIECLKMLHPFMPFVTEAIFQKLGAGKMLMVEKW